MSYTKEQLIEALINEYEYLCHDDFDPDEDITPEQYREQLVTFTVEQLVGETTTGEHYPLDLFMENYG